jgi:hypothetical protein
MQVCREIGITLEQGMNLSQFELKCWAAFFRIEQERNKELLKNGRHRNN